MDLILTHKMNAQSFVWDQNERTLREVGKNQDLNERWSFSGRNLCGNKGHRTSMTKVF